jgi:Ca2+-binding RTX toxin-like protein
MSSISLGDLSGGLEFQQDLQGIQNRLWSSAGTSWTTDGGLSVSLEIDDLVYDSDLDVVTSGTLVGLSIVLPGNLTAEPDFVITGLSVDYAALYDDLDGLSASQRDNLFWSTVLAGDDTIDLGPGDHKLVLAGDGVGLNLGQTLNAGDDAISGIVGLDSEIVGDIYTVVAGSMLHGGNDTMEISDSMGGIIIGDAGGAYGTVIGGADIINVTASEATTVIGDVYWSHAAVIIGGNDTIVVAGAGAPSLAITGDMATSDDGSYVIAGDDTMTVSGGSGTTLGVVGDLTRADGGSYVIGGDDTISVTPSSAVWMNVTGDVNRVEDSEVIGGNDTIRITGSSGGNYIWGDVGSAYEGSRIKGGNDAIQGGAGIDNIYGDVGGLSGNVHVTGGNDVLRGGGGNDQIYGDTGENSEGATVVGGNDQLYGEAGSDTLYGAGGNDMLYGGVGNDLLDGGAGKDIFVFDTKLGKSNVDTIADFSHADDIFHIDNAVFKGLGLGALSKKDFTSISSATSSKGVDGSDRILYDKANGDLYFDRDGAGTKYDRVLFASVEDGTKLDHTDFLIM